MVFVNGTGISTAAATSAAAAASPTLVKSSSDETTSCVEGVPLVEFMYPVFMYRGCTSGGVYVPCIYVRGCTSVEFMYLVFMYRGCTSGGVYVPCIYVPRMYLWWSLCTLYLCTEDVPLVEFMYLVFMYRGCTCGGVYVPCIYVPRLYLVEFIYLYLHACQARVTVGDSCLCCCVSVTSFER